MFKPIIAGLTALSLTLATTAPVSAQGMDREDVGKLLIGLAAVAVIGAAIEENRDRRADTTTQAHDNGQRNGINRNHNWSDLNRQNQGHNARRTVPYECLRTVETRFGAQRLFAQRCLERNYRHASRLPERCAVRLYTANGPVRGYDPLCLREQGYQSDRRR